MKHLTSITRVRNLMSSLDFQEGICNQMVGGSNPPGGSIYCNELEASYLTSFLSGDHFSTFSPFPAYFHPLSSQIWRCCPSKLILVFIGGQSRFNQQE